MEIEGIEEPVVLPWEYASFGGPVPVAVDGRPRATRQEAMDAAKPGPPGSYAYYWATHRMSVPTILNHATAPRLMSMIEDATLRLKNEVQGELTTMAIGLALGTAFNVVAQVAGASAEAKALKVRATAADEVKAGRAAGQARAGQAPEGALPSAPKLRAARPGDKPVPMPGESPEMYARRTYGEHEQSWEQLPEPAKKLRIDAAKREMGIANVQYCTPRPKCQLLTLSQWWRL